MEKINAAAAYEQTAQVRDDIRNDQLDALILAGPDSELQTQNVQGPSEDEGLRPIDTFEKAQAPVPAQASQPAQAVNPVSVESGDYAFKVDGRGAAVALQENLQELLKEDQNAFAAAAQALGVSDLPEFQELVENGSSLAVFSAVDTDRLQLVNQNREPVDFDDLSSLVNAEVIVKPGNEVPQSEGIKDNPVESAPAPIDNINEQLQTPVIIDPAENQRLKAVNPAGQQGQDAAATVV